MSLCQGAPDLPACCCPAPDGTGLVGRGFSASASPVPSVGFRAEPPGHTDFILHVISTPWPSVSPLPARGTQAEVRTPGCSRSTQNHIPLVCSPAPVTIWHRCGWFRARSSRRAEPTRLLCFSALGGSTDKAPCGRICGGREPVLWCCSGETCVPPSHLLLHPPPRSQALWLLKPARTDHRFLFPLPDWQRNGAAASRASPGPLHGLLSLSAVKS